MDLGIPNQLTLGLAVFLNLAGRLRELKTLRASSTSHRAKSTRAISFNNPFPRRCIRSMTIARLSAYDVYAELLSHGRFLMVYIL